MEADLSFEFEFPGLVGVTGFSNEELRCLVSVGREGITLSSSSSSSSSDFWCALVDSNLIRTLQINANLLENHFEV